MADRLFRHFNQWEIHARMRDRRKNRKAKAESRALHDAWLREYVNKSRCYAGDK